VLPLIDQCFQHYAFAIADEFHASTEYDLCNGKPLAYGLFFASFTDLPLCTMIDG
jgi:hypothetical protein